MDESAWQRATKGTRHAIVDTLRYQVAALIISAVGGIIVAYAIPSTATLQQQEVWGVVGALGTALALMLMTLLWNLFRAPYKQRDEAQQRVHNLEAGPEAALSIEGVSTQWVKKAPYRTLWRSMYATITNNTSAPASLKYVTPSVDGQRTPLDRIIDGEWDDMNEALNGSMPSLQAPLFARNQVFSPGESKAGVFMFIDWAGILAGDAPYTPAPNLRVTLVENNGYVHELPVTPRPDKAGALP